VDTSDRVGLESLYGVRTLRWVGGRIGADCMLFTEGGAGLGLGVWGEDL